MDLEALRQHMLKVFGEVKRLRAENEELKQEVKRLQVTAVKSKKAQVNEEIEREDLAFYIKSQREARGLSLSRFARLVGSTATTISNYENRKGNILGMREMAETIRGLRRAKNE